MIDKVENYPNEVRDHNMDDIRHLADSFEESKENKEIQKDINKNDNSEEEEEDSNNNEEEEDNVVEDFDDEENSENDDYDDEDVIVDSSDDRPIIDTEGV